MGKHHFDLYIERDISLSDELIVVQTLAIKSPFDNEPDRIHLNIKPKSMKLKLDLNLNTNSSNYCRDKAETLARVSKPNLFPAKQVDKNFYTSTRNCVDDDQLFVCKVVDDRLICRPVAHFLTMRSDLSHFDLKDEIDPKEEVKPVSVKFASSERQGSSTRQRETCEGVDEESEEFQQLKFKAMSSRDATSQRNLLFGGQARVKPDPDAQEEVEFKPNLTSNIDVKPKIERMDVDDIYASVNEEFQSSPKKSNIIRHRVKECLRKAKLVSFEEVYLFLRNYREFDKGSPRKDSLPVNTKDIIDALNEYAVLVQGNWAIKSETLHGDSGDRERTDVTGISINLFTAARDYLLWLFTQNRIVSRPDFAKRVRIPDYDILEIFNQLATFRSDIKKWELKLPTDTKFLEQFPEVVQRQSSLWKVRKASKLSIFH